ncbi:MAG: glycosyltransferase family 4 protein [Desulfobacterales bacterium]|nr:glycosyltransferase family 4 protein [Desulfobacterales bacterium]
MAKELAQAMGGQGWEVTVAAGYPHHPYGRLYYGWYKKWIISENQDGFRLVRGWHLINPSPSVLTKSLVVASQGLSRLIGALSIGRPDVLISFGIPLLGPIISAALAKIYRAKLITVIYDLYPDVAVNLGKLNNPLMIVAARKIEQIAYRWSDRIVVLSEGFQRTLVNQKGVVQEKINIIPVWLDAADVKPMDRITPWRGEMKIPPEKFVVLYAGTIGLISGAEIVLDAARHLESYQDILFLFVGTGHAKDRVETRAREMGLKNIRFLPFQPRERLSEVQATADVSLVTLAPGRGKTSVPSKVLGYMAAARPVIAAVDEDCDTADLIHTSGCGLVVPPGRGGLLAEAILHFYENPKERLMRGEAGHRHFLKHFERQGVLNRYIETIQDVLKSS